MKSPIRLAWLLLLVLSNNSLQAQIPEEAKGFKGALRGEIIARTNDSVTLLVKKLNTPPKNCRCKDANSLIGRRIEIRLVPEAFKSKTKLQDERARLEKRAKGKDESFFAVHRRPDDPYLTIPEMQLTMWMGFKKHEGWHPDEGVDYRLTLLTNKLSSKLYLAYSYTGKGAETNKVRATVMAGGRTPPECSQEWGEDAREFAANPSGVLKCKLQVPPGSKLFLAAEVPFDAGPNDPPVKCLSNVIDLPDAELLEVPEE
jgi:hypothetical protein